MNLKLAATNASNRRNPAQAEANMLRTAADMVEFLQLIDPTVVVDRRGVCVRALHSGRAIELQRDAGTVMAEWRIGPSAVDEAARKLLLTKLKELQTQARNSQRATRELRTLQSKVVKMAPGSLQRPVGRVSLDDFAATQTKFFQAQVPRTESTPAPSTASQGQTYLLSLIEDGTLVPTAALSQAWGLTPQRLRRLVQDGELTGIKVNNRLWVPVSLASFPSREGAHAVCRAMAEWPAVEQLLFLVNVHSSLAGRTVAQAVGEGHIERVLQLIERLAQRR